MLKIYLSILAAAMTIQAYQEHGWSTAVLSALFWILVFGVAAGAGRAFAFARGRAPKKGGAA